MNKKRSGFSLIELMVVMIALMLVGGMGFEILWRGTRTINRGVSMNSRNDRLRLLERVLDRDLGGLYPGLEKGKVTVVESPEQNSPSMILRMEILQTVDNEEVVLREVAYGFEEFPEGSGVMAVVRSEDSDLAPGPGPDADRRMLFSLSPQEGLEWSLDETDDKAGAGWMEFTLNLYDRRFSEFITQSKALLPEPSVK